MYCAALDTTPGMAGFALMKDDKVVSTAHWNIRGREASKLSILILDEMEKLNITLDDITHWSVGSGPGSFTALRQAAALVSGWSFNRTNLKSRCVPGAVALAASVPVKDGDVVCALYDGRNSEILYYNIEFRDGDFHDTGCSGVLNAQQSEAFFKENAFSSTVCFAAEYETIKKIIPQQLEPVQVEKSDPSWLCKVKSIAFDNDLTRLVYIRPAVYVN